MTASWIWFNGASILIALFISYSGTPKNAVYGPELYTVIRVGVDLHN